MTTATQPLISVVMPIRNAEKTLHRAIDSVLTQTACAIELIVIDGASTDSTPNILQAYAPHIAYWHSRPDLGAADAQNQGNEIAKGDWIITLNADDWFEPDLFATVKASIQQHPEADMITCGTRIVTQGPDQTFIERHVFSDPSLLSLSIKNLMNGRVFLGARFIRRDFLQQQGLFQVHDEKGDYLYSNDTRWMLRAYLSEPEIKNIILPKVGLTYLAHPASFSFSGNRTIQARSLEEHHAMLALWIKTELRPEDKILLRLWRVRTYLQQLMLIVRSKIFYRAPVTLTMAPDI